MYKRASLSLPSSKKCILMRFLSHFKARRFKIWCIQIVFVTLVLLAWEVWAKMYPSVLIPPPSQCFIALYELFYSNILIPDISASLGRVLIGFLLALSVGLLFGFVLSVLGIVRFALTGLLELLRPIPPIAWIPIIVAWLGIGNASAWCIIFIGAFFPIFTNTLFGVTSIEKIYLETAKVLGASRFRTFKNVIFPSTLPNIFAGIRVGLGFAWMCVVAAEMFAAQSGLGYAIQLNRQLFRLDRVIAYMAVIAVIGVMIMRFISWLERMCIPWKQTNLKNDFYGEPSINNNVVPVHDIHIVVPDEPLVNRNHKIFEWQTVSGVSVKITDARFHYPERTEFVLDGTTMNVHSGEVYCILGRSGCGKSTLLRLLAGLEQVSAGTVQIDGTRVLGHRSDTTMVFQDFSLFPWKTVEGNILFSLKQKEFCPINIKAESSHFLGLVGLQHKASDWPHLLSGGQMQRVAFARALATCPRLFLLDEPFSALDIRTREALQEDMSTIFKKTEATIVMVTHDIAEAVFMADRVAVMDNGGIIIGEYDIPMERPRDKKFRNSQVFQEMTSTLWKQLNSTQYQGEKT